MEYGFPAPQVKCYLGADIRGVYHLLGVGVVFRCSR